ncbi:hypothetical protein HDU97_007571 [Phlyctochytrium planicorne]|nr:hypothetical protein HDU97_007571 [Phlyctochytrium planicorne]
MERVCQAIKAISVIKSKRLGLNHQPPLGLGWELGNSPSPSIARKEERKMPAPVASIHEGLGSISREDVPNDGTTIGVTSDPCTPPSLNPDPSLQQQQSSSSGGTSPSSPLSSPATLPSDACNDPVDPSQTDIAITVRDDGVQAGAGDTIEASIPNPSPPHRRRRRRRRLQRLAEVFIRYDRPKEYFSETMPSELEGILSNIVYFSRMRILNTELRSFKTLTDYTPAARTLGYPIPQDDNEKTRFLWVVLGTLVTFIFILVISTAWCLSKPFKPVLHVRTAIESWQKEDHALGLRYRTHRTTDDSRPMAFKGIQPGWCISIERYIRLASDAPVEANDELEEMHEALPIYQVDAQPPPPQYS